MSLLDLLFRRRSPSKSARHGLLDRLRDRLPPGNAPGLLPSPDPAEGEEERLLGERLGIELHRHAATGRSMGLSRRVAAVASSAQRLDPRELEEALADLEPWELPSLLEALAARRDFAPPRVAEVARRLAPLARDFRTLAGALALLSKGTREADRDLLRLAARSHALARFCADAVLALEPAEVEPALLDLASVSDGLARSLILEQLAIRHLPDGASAGPLDRAEEALRLAGAIEEPIERAYAAVPLLEVSKAVPLLGSRPELAPALASCLEAVSRGGWNGGPGPGLARLPGAMATAEALIGRQELPAADRLRAARAVVDARPIPPGPVRLAADKLLASLQAT
ncbi:hypothetical protein [Vulgatibacter incomptus]|uniref:Uncharacterized protein n=1 Tax=Vulgatibacter incomptus TaxID=1391653 RepID=A0A0K1PDC2_9BACT|nr:hypothetical protein [Vulgatibacter incomptus]AKU91520.1 hypothetical protein AKJ08_1907 [Vulgatibacter incomptus]